MNKRYKLLKQCDGTEKTSAQWTEYRKVKNKVTKMMRQAEAKYWHDQFSEAASTQDFWKTYRKATKKTINTRIGPLTSKDGKEITDDSKKSRNDEQLFCWRWPRACTEIH